MNARVVVVLIGLVCSGCAGLSLTQRPVAFDNPYEILAIETVAPSLEEREGVLLRYAVPDEPSQQKYREQTVMYAKIEADEGIRVSVEGERLETRRRGPSEKSIDLTTATRIKGEKRDVVMHTEVSDQGALIRFISGEYASSFGRILVHDWQRTAVFPEEKVVIGDTWNYTEKIDVELVSWLVKEVSSQPYSIKARSEFEGISMCLGRRCAVIKTIVVKKESHHFKMLFADLIFTTHTALEERSFFDYEAGELVAQIVQIDARTTSENNHLRDISKGQTVSYVVESVKK